MSRLSREARRRQMLEKHRTDQQKAMQNPSGGSKYAKKQEKKRTGKWVPPEQPVAPAPKTLPSRFSRPSIWRVEEDEPVFPRPRTPFSF